MACANDRKEELAPPATAYVDAWQQTSRAWQGKRPNVVLVTLDTVRADRIGVYGSDVSTPNIDRLAAEGTLFANASTTVPFTLPAHASMMTGLYPPSHGVRENVGFVVPDSLPTLAEELRDGGYETAGFVSAFVLDRRWGISQGFEHYLDDFKIESSETSNLGAVQRPGEDTVQSALGWLGERDDSERPFFLWVHLYDAHDPYTPAEPYHSAYPGRPYEAEVAYTDALVGRLIEGLEKEDEFDSSVFVVTSDHGEGLGDHGESFHGFFIYDSTVRVPLVVRLPGGEASGQIVSEAVSHVDLRPTILEVVDQASTGPSQGRSLVPDLVGFSPVGRAVYAESLYPNLHYGWSALRALRGDRFKFIETSRPELYALDVDPEELANALQTERAEARSMRAELLQLRDQLDAAAPAQGATADLDEDTLRQLQALGYLAGRGQDHVERAEAADPKDRIALHQAIMRAQSDVGEGALDAARERLQRALAQDADLLDAHQMLGGIALETREYEQASEHYAAALALNPDHQSSLWGLATSYRRLGRAEDALPGYRKLQALAPEDSKAVVALTEVLVDLGRLPDALAEVQRLVSRADAAPRFYNRYGELLALVGRGPDARRAFETAVAGDPQLAQPYYNLGVLAEEAGDLGAARDYYGKAVGLRPAHYRAHFNLGRLAGAGGDLRSQESAYRGALEANPEFVRGHYSLAKNIMDQGGDLSSAESLVRQGFALDPSAREGPYGYFVLADILNRAGRTGEARDALDEGRKLAAQR